MKLRRVILAALGALLLFIPAVAEAKRVRVFAVGPRFDLNWVDSREHFRAKLIALIDKRERGKLPATIQQGADDVASQLLGPTDPKRPVETARDLITLPEDLGLLTALSGMRGEAARRQSTLTNAIAATIGAYGDQAAYYQGKFPELAQRPFPPTRLLNVALTDTFARVGVEVFAELADRYDAYLEAGVNMVTDWRVVCISKATYEPPAGNPPCEEENPGLVGRLRTPEEAGRTYAYEATTDHASNLALLFDPDGKIIAKEAKSYPTPTEAPGQLDLRPGPVTGLRALDTPVGTLGFVTSRDAFMPDVVERLDQQHVEVLVQPEFFVGDFVRSQGMWSPDTLKASGFSAMQRLPSINALVLPETTGTVFELTADAQQHIALKPRSTKTGPRGGLVGQDPELGFAQVQNWLVRDPAHPGERMAQRRPRLGQAGEAASATGDGPACTNPTEAGPCKGGQVEGVLAQDVQVQVTRSRRAQRRRKRGATPFAINRPIASSPNVQRNVALATRGDRVWAVFEERETGRDRIQLARSFNGGRTWTRAKRPIAVTPAERSDEWWPSVAAGADGSVWLAWQDNSTGTHQVRYARSTDEGRHWSVPRAVAAGAGPQWKPSIAATGEGRAFVAWIDERERFADERDLPQAALYGARLEASGPLPAARLDGGEVAELARTQDNSWSPSVAAEGDRVLVSWMDLRTYDWRIYAIESADGGATFGAEKPVQDSAPISTDPLAPPENEALNADPASVLTASGALVAFTDFRKRADSATRPHALYDTLLAAPGGRNLQVDPHGPSQVSTFAPAAVALSAGDVLVAWQDMRAGPADIYVARAKGSATAGEAVRVDDSGSAGWNQWRPALATTARGRVLAAWEDERDGPANVFASYVATRRLP